MGTTAAPPVPVITDLPTTSSRALVAADVEQPMPSAPAAEADKMADEVNVRAASPREMANLCLDLYAGGMISYDDYAVLASQPELHPDYNKTVGALTGEPAGPNRRRDFVRIWDDQLQFELRHSPGNAPAVRQALRIRDILKQLPQPMPIGDEI